MSLTDFVSKQTVKNKLHNLVIKEEIPKQDEKKKVRILHIDADKDHISEQVMERDSQGRKRLVRGSSIILGRDLF